MSHFRFITQDGDGEIVLRTTRPVPAIWYKFWDRSGDSNYIQLPCRTRFAVNDWFNRVVNLECYDFDIIKGLLVARQK